MPAVKEETKRPRVAPVEPRPGSLLLTIREVMHLTGYSYRQIAVFIKLKKLRNVSLDRTVRIPREDVLRVMLDGREVRR